MTRQYASDAEREAVISQVMTLGFSREDAEFKADYPDIDLVEINPRTGGVSIPRGPRLGELTRAHQRK